MNLKNRQLIAILAALCWIFAQNISLDHQFTSEHLSQNDSHICLSFANDNDDLLISSAAVPELTTLQSNRFVHRDVVLNSSVLLGFQARAPPTPLS